MPIPILMPALSPTMTEGAVAAWHKKEGEPVAAGDVIAEIETDKANMELEAVDDGVLGRILVPEGTQGVKVKRPIALLLSPGEDPSALDDAVPETAPELESAPAPESAPEPADTPADAPPAPTPEPQPDATPATSGERIFASPLARRLAREAGLDLAAIQGSGPHGRIVKADIEAARAGGAPAAPARTAPAATPAAPEGGFEDQPVTSMRRVVAQRMTESKQTVPHFYLTVDCRIDALLALRADANALAERKISVNDFVVRAAALALAEVPGVNVAWNGESIRRFAHADIAVAVATERGLITPVLRRAETKTVGALAEEMAALAEKARAGKLLPEEYQDGTFTISNLGMFGVKEFAAIINPPQAAILAVGAGEARPVVEDGDIRSATVMTCTLAVDHRSVDGALGAEWLAAFKRLIEAPLRLLL